VANHYPTNCKRLDVLHVPAGSPQPEFSRSAHGPGPQAGKVTPLKNKAKLRKLSYPGADVVGEPLDQAEYVFAGIKLVVPDQGGQVHTEVQQT